MGSPLGPVFMPTEELPSVGVKGVIRFDSKANLSLAILGSVRAIRDYTEGPSLLHPVLQEGVRFKLLGAGSLSISRLWLDNVTEMTLSFSPGSSGHIQLCNDKAVFEPGDYLFSARYNYPQLKQLSTSDVLRHGSYLPEQKQETKALSFLSYSEKILAGAWRFLTYSGRDDMISALLLQPVLTHTATEAVIGSVLERIDHTDGSVCHEEIIGDYAAFLNLEDGTPSTAARCDYSMIDTDYFLPILMHAYFVESGAGRRRLENLLSTPAGKVEVKNKGLTWGDLLTLLVNKIMGETAPFASSGGQKKENLIRLRDGHDTGVWRDSVYGLGGGRIPFDVNVALAPAALRSIAILARIFDRSIFKDDWRELSTVAERYAQVWEDNTLEFFKLNVPVEIARQRLEAFARTSNFYNGPSHAEVIDSDISYHALALDGHNGLEMVPVLNTDACCRIFFLNGTNQPRLTNYLNSTALSIIRPFPAGLMTPLGLVVANPAYAGIEELSRNFSNSAYHGTVIWSWQQVAMARGLEKQLDRCNSAQRPDYCSNTVVYNNVKNAYNVLWDVIEANRKYLSDEVWTWVYKDQEYHHTALSSLVPPPGIDRPAESNIIQLWSLTFLAVKRNEELR